jgi:hypothetical protein
VGDSDADGVDVRPSVDVSAGMSPSHVRMMRVTVMGVNEVGRHGKGCPGDPSIGSDYVAQGES